MEARRTVNEMLEMKEQAPTAHARSPRSLLATPSASKSPGVNPRTPNITGITPRIALQTPSRPDTPDELDLGLPMIDADAFLAPPDQDVAEETEEDHQGFRLPRVPNVEPARKAATAARIKAKRRALSTSSASSNRPTGGARARLKNLTRALSRDSAISSSSSSSSSSNASSISLSRWRFWRNDSSSDSSDASDDDDEDSFVPPEPAYELVLPTLGMQPFATQPFTSVPVINLEAALLRLSAFWDERRQSDHAGGDLAGDGKQPEPVPQSGMHPVADRPVGDGAGWWLDIQAPTVHDMRLLRKYVPLHPLTIEDILHQDPREKVERFDRLRYTLVVFRAIDDSYFRWHSPDSPPSQTSSSTSITGKGSPDKPFGATEKDVEMKELPPYRSVDPNSATTRGSRLEICEGVGGKEGLEGVGVGAVNLYLVIFRDGIVTFHYEPLPKHTGRVFNKIQQYGASRPINSHWIAYGLLDSVVDAFFPIVSYIEQEAKEIDTYLADPLAVNGIGEQRKRRKRPRWWRWLSKHLAKPETISLPKWLPSLPSLPYLIPRPVGRPTEQLRNVELPEPEEEWKKDGRLLLRKMTDTRKLVTGMSRLLTAKFDVMRAVRKRVRDLPAPSERDISLYFGDLQDHIATLHQSLVWYESVLSHDHPAFTGMLRLGLERAKMGTDYRILRFYIVILIVLPAQVVIGLFSMNVPVPENGDRYDHVEDDGVTVAPLNWFYIICAITCFISIVVCVLGWFTLRKLKRPGVGI